MEVSLQQNPRPLQPDNGSWWSRPAGGREVLRIALPMVVSTLSWTLMTLADRVILNQVSGAAMSAGFSASVLWFASLSLLWGICSYASTFVSQYHGDGQPDKIGTIVWQGVWLAGLFTPLAFAAMWVAPYLFASHTAEMAELETRFFRILCWGAPGMLAAQALEGFYSGRGKTWVVMLVDAGAVLLNLALDCVLVLGWGGLVESWGMDGAAWGTTAAQWCRATTFAVLVLQRSNRKTYGTLAGMRWEPSLITRLLRFGGPSGVQMVLDVGGFAIFVVLVGQLGLLETEATSLAFTISHVAFMPVWGLGMATAVLVGQHLGENRPHLSERATRTTLGLAWGFMGFISLCFVLAPNLFLRLFWHEGASGPSAGEVQQLAVHLLRFVAAYNMFDAAAIIFVSALKGAGDTRFIMATSMFMSTLMAGATWLGINYFGINVHGCWVIITGVVWLMALVYFARYRTGKWRSMRVIEQVHHRPPTGVDAIESDRPDDWAEPALQSTG